jgi:hypothetical protein
MEYRRCDLAVFAWNSTTSIRDSNSGIPIDQFHKRLGAGLLLRNDTVGNERAIARPTPEPLQPATNANNSRPGKKCAGVRSLSRSI